MPMIHTRVSTPITPEQEQTLKTRLGKAIALLPGKSERWLMLRFSDNERLYFQGDNARPIAFAEVGVLGKAPKAAYEALTAELCAIYEDVLGISPDCVYVQYTETEHWGWNGGNF